MKILMVIDTLGAGGKERRFTELVKALRTRQEVDMEVVIMSNNIHFTEIEYLGTRIHKVIRKSRKDLSIYRKFWSILRSFKPDAVHCWESMTAVYLAPVCKVLNCPLVNGMVTNVPLRRNVFNHHWLRARLTFPLSRVIVSNTQAGLDAYNVPDNRGVVIHNGFNFERLNCLSDRSHLRKELDINTRYVVGMVASFCTPKDYPTYYTAAMSLLEQRNDITFISIGSGTDSIESARLVENRKDHFRLLGSRKDIESCINLFDIGVLASITEGFSNSIMEYMALGKPVVASKGGGTPELVVEGETGFLVNESDSKMMAERIKLLLDDIKLRNEMGKHGRDRIAEHFSIDRMTTDYINLYKRICN
ncbi:MAG: glycosyltransferase [Bacteroidales bacterium]